MVIERGILTWSVLCRDASTPQGLPGPTFDLDNRKGELPRRWGHPCCPAYLRYLMDVVRVHRWSDLAGQLVRVARIAQRSALIAAVGDPLEDRWIHFDTLYQQVNTR